jgi:phosphoglycolate phosphatase
LPIGPLSGITEAMSTFSGVIFDLDGTLLNTLDDLADSCNRQLARCGYPTHPVDAYRYFVGNGARKIVERALPSSQKSQRRVDEFLKEFVADYSAHCFEKTRPYEGIPELLKGLHQRGLPMAVLSNKPDAETRKVVSRYFGDDLFAHSYGQREGIPHKPDPAGVIPILSDMGLKPEETAFVGDTWIDMRTAAASGCVPVGVLWGFRDRAELKENGARLLAATPAELFTVLTA